MEIPKKEEAVEGGVMGKWALVLGPTIGIGLFIIGVFLYDKIDWWLIARRCKKEQERWTEKGD